MMNDKEEILNEYVIMFESNPPLCMMMSYSHPIYQNLMKVAIDTKTPITLEQVEKEMEKQNIKYDLGE